MKGLSLTDDNYTKASEVLEDWYGNKKAIIAAYTKNLLDVICLYRLYNYVRAQVKYLQGLGITENFSALIMESH